MKREGQGREMTFEEIGKALGISGVRARELYFNALKKLRRRAEHLREYAEKSR